MASRDDDDPKGLERRLARLQAAMGPRAVRRAARDDRRAVRSAKRGPGSSVTLLALSIAFITMAIVTGNHALLWPGVILGCIGAARVLSRALSGRRTASSHPHIGMGADVAEGAIVEPGAVVQMGADVGAGAIIEPGAIVEMGADVGAGARVQKGAVVRMGASVHKDAVIETGAVVGWGCDIEAGAVVGAGAVIGAGSTVSAGARVPPGMRLLPGATFAKGVGMSAPARAPAPGDERRARIEASCARIETEIGQLPETFREHLGATGETATALRTTCLELLDRERVLRVEASEDSLTFLDNEKTELEKRAAAATDAAVQKSLRSAIAAIDDQKRQRLQLKTHADRLDAEVTRLQWTLDGMATQLVRLRSAGVGAAQAPSGEVVQSVQQLHEEIDAIADALEQVRSSEQPVLPPLEEISNEPGGAASRDRVR